MVLWGADRCVMSPPDSRKTNAPPGVSFSHSLSLLHLKEFAKIWIRFFFFFFSAILRKPPDCNLTAAASHRGEFQFLVLSGCSHHELTGWEHVWRWAERKSLHQLLLLLLKIMCPWAKQFTCSHKAASLNPNPSLFLVLVWCFSLEQAAWVLKFRHGKLKVLSLFWVICSDEYLN